MYNFYDKFYFCLTFVIRSAVPLYSLKFCLICLSTAPPLLLYLRPITALKVFIEYPR